MKEIKTCATLTLATDAVDTDIDATPTFTINTAFAIAAALALIVATMARPAHAADPYNGQQLAERWCAACHVVQSAQRQANADAPPFEEIAKRTGFSENGLSTFLLNPHGNMPDMNLTRIEAGDIAAYVGKLK